MLFVKSSRDGAVTMEGCTATRSVLLQGTLVGNNGAVWNQELTFKASCRCTIMDETLLGWYIYKVVDNAVYHHGLLLFAT